MKTSFRKIALAGMTCAFVLTSGATLWAHDGEWNDSHHFYSDRHGYWDHHDHYQKFTAYHGHHGYYSEKHVFISVN